MARRISRPESSDPLAESSGASSGTPSGGVALDSPSNDVAPRSAGGRPVIGIVAKQGHPLSKLLTERLIAWIDSRGLDLRVDREIADELGVARDRPEVVVSREEMTTAASPIVVLGGDGTLISVSRHPSGNEPLILGVNLGTLGFLTEITVDEMMPALEETLAGRAQSEPRFLLRAEVSRVGGERSVHFAINDIVITKEALARIFGVNLWVNHDHAALIRGDGVIVSTPCGSTAYSLAAGGSIVHPQVEALLLTPICPHSLTSRPLVLPGSSRVTLEVVTGSQRETDRVFLTIDGQDGMELSHGDRVVVTTSVHAVRFVKSPSRNYFQVLGTKLKWATA